MTAQERRDIKRAVKGLWAAWSNLNGAVTDLVLANQSGVFVHRAMALRREVSVLRRKCELMAKREEARSL